MVEVSFLLHWGAIIRVGPSFIDSLEGPFPGEVPASCAMALDLALEEDPFRLRDQGQPTQPAPDSS